jgi:hypothetical protein
VTKGPHKSDRPGLKGGRVGRLVRRALRWDSIVLWKVLEKEKPKTVRLLIEQ